MDWFTGKSKSDQRNKSITPLQTQRMKQIEQLKKVNPNVYEVQRGVDYRLNLVVSGIDILLFVHLPSNFPQDKPIVTINPSIQHPWVNAENVITGCPELNDFVIHSDLGKIIKDLLENLKRNGRVHLPTQPNYPPNSTPMTSEQQLINNYSSYAMSTASNSDNMSYPQYSFLPMPSQTLVSNSTPSAHMYGQNGLFKSPNYVNESQSADESKYREVAVSREKLTEMAMNVNTIRNISLQKKHLFESNTNLAETNLNLKGSLENSRGKLLAEYTKLSSLRDEFGSLLKKQDSLLRAVDSSNLKCNLKVATVEAEDTGEKIAKEFFDGKIDAAKFIESYTQARTLYHARRVKEEYLQGLSSET